MMQQPKLELVIRKVDNCLILGGVIVTESFKANDLSAMNMFGRVENDEVIIVVSKEQFEPKSSYNESLDLECLSSLATSEVWRGYCSPDPTEFGGIIIGRDNFLFEFENANEVSRMAVISVIQDKANILNIDEHAMLRSYEGIEFQDCYQFRLKQDKSDSIQPLVDSLRGDAILSLYRKPFFTLQDGTPYRLSTMLPKAANELHEKRNREVLELGDVTEETAVEMSNQRLLSHRDNDFLEYQKEMAVREPLIFAKYSRLLTEDEYDRVDQASKEYLNQFMCM